MPFVKHPLLALPEDSQILWRYLDFPKFVYRSPVKTLNLDRAKASGLVDPNSVHIANIDQLRIDKPRELSHGTKSKF